LESTVSPDQDGTHPGMKIRLLRATAIILGIAALVFAVLGVVLIIGGAFPPEGGGSLGHVGMMIGGAICAFFALVLGLFTALCISKSRAAAVKTAE
jgi:hypothetical protein